MAFDYLTHMIQQVATIFAENIMDSKFDQPLALGFVVLEIFKHGSI